MGVRRTYKLILLLLYSTLCALCNAYVIGLPVIGSLHFLHYYLELMVHIFRTDWTNFQDFFCNGRKFESIELRNILWSTLNST